MKKKQNTNLFGMSASTILTILGLIVASGGTFGGYYVYKGKTFLEATPQYMSEVIDGDTFKIESGEVIRLGDIDAPEINSCFGIEAKDELEKLLRGQKLKLLKDIQERDNFGRLVRFVKIEKSGEENIFVNKYLVENGFAEYKSSENIEFQSELVKAESKAQSEFIGIWKNCPIEKPKTKTAQRIEQATEPTDPNCKIKGNISNIGLGKIYILPHCANYKNTHIDPTKGEKYFCTSEEAERDGFKLADGCR